jgi:ABC-2 type transport system ATP-binding protein
MGTSRARILSRPVISVAHLVRTFGALRALDDVSFEVARGEVVGLLGPNGAGKTTAMRILAGYLPATSGAVRVAGFDVVRESLEVRRRIGYLPESVPLYREHRVVEMLAFQARLHGLPRREARQRIPAVLAEVGLADRGRDLIGNLSRGLRQRAGLAVALLPRPAVLILDEPTSGLDPIGTREFKDLLARLRDSGKTILLCSHLLADVQELCERMCLLYRGEKVLDGRLADLLTVKDVAELRVRGVDDGKLDRIAAAVRELGVDVVSVGSATESLEQLFVRTVRERQKP